MTLPSSRPARTAPPVGEIVRWVRQMARRAGDCTLVVTVPAPEDAAERALDLLPSGYSFVWDPGGEWVWIGGGAAIRLEEGNGDACGSDSSGADRFVRLRRRAEDLFRETEAVIHPDCGVPSYVPRLFGGLAFTGGGACQAPWSEFGDGCFTLPRWLYRGGEAGMGATLSLALTATDRSGRSLEDWLERLAAVLDALASPSEGATPHSGAPPLPPLSRADLGEWCEEVKRVRDAIAAGRCEKVVLARRLQLDLGAPLEPERLLPHLDRTGRGSFRFLFRRPHASFLGTTPERLIARRGRRIRTEALAGSIEGGEDRARQLLESAKDRMEHSFVVRHLVARLDPLCRRLEWSAEPRIRTLRHLLHLETPLDGELRSDTHVLDLVAALHPTPAVGGVPTSEAVRWIAEHERWQRGWYSGPVGWLDARGDGEFAVALRSCVLAGSRVYLWAGAGLVADSDPAAEYEETVLKLTGIVRALEAALAGEPQRRDAGAEPEMAGVGAVSER